MKKILIVLVAFVLSFTVGLQVAQAGKMERLLRELEIQLERPGFGRDFYVCQSNSPFYSTAVKKYEPYADGVRRLYTSITNSYNACVADRGDTIYLVSGFTNTALRHITLSKNSISIIGIGPDRPTLGATGTEKLITVLADNITLKGLHLIPSRATSTYIIKVDGGTLDPVKDLLIEDCYIEGGVPWGRPNDVIVLDSAENLVIKDTRITSPYGTVFDPATFVDFQTHCTNTRIDNCVFDGFVSSAGIADDAPGKGLVMTNVIIAVTQTNAAIPAITLDSNPIGVASNCMFSGTEDVTRTNANLGINMAMQNCMILGGHFITLRRWSGTPLAQEGITNP